MEQAQMLADEFSGPVLFHYVWWILLQAQKRNIKKLYFLARDGYTLLRIANAFCKKFHLDISLEYLFCSRASLRLPTYAFIGDEAYDLIFQYGYQVTLQSLMLRCELNDIERKQVYSECGLQCVNEEKILSHEEFCDYTARLKKSLILKKAIVRYSKNAYEDAVGYLRQSGLFEQDTVAIVDSGWVGSMQRSLRQILESAGYQGRLIGFYFGMFSEPKSKVDGEYLTWYFAPRGDVVRKVCFCNNLFECLLSAPHGMTKKYMRDSEGVYRPILVDIGTKEEIRVIQEQSDCICRYAERQLLKTAFNCFQNEKAIRIVEKIIKRHMVHPSRTEVAYYGRFLFSDDIIEGNRNALANISQKDLLRRYFFLRRILQRLIRHEGINKQADLYWPYGVAALYPTGEAVWWRLNLYIWNMIKYGLH